MRKKLRDFLESLKKVVRNVLALLGVWGSTYLQVLEEISAEMADVAEDLVFPFLILGVVGMGSAFRSAYRLSRDPVWRAKHGLLGRPGWLAPRRG